MRGRARMVPMQDVATPLANQLLIASPALSDPHFARAVALICQHDDEGAMGVVVNRPSEYTLGEVLRQMNLASHDPRLDDQVVPVADFYRVKVSELFSKKRTADLVKPRQVAKPSLKVGLTKGGYTSFIREITAADFELDGEAMVIKI